MKTAIAFLLLSCSLAASDAFRCEEAPRFYQPRQIDAGHGLVVAVGRSQTSMLSGSHWYPLGGVRLSHVSVGPAGVWGVDRSNKVYKMVGGRFLAARSATMKMVAAGGNGFVLGIRASNNRTYCLTSRRAAAFRSVSSLRWTSKSGKMEQISCGKGSCWGVTSRNRIYVLQRITSSNCRSSRWTRVSGKFKTVKVGEDGSVFGLTHDGRVYERTGFSRTRPLGRRWNQIPTCIAADFIAYNNGRLWIGLHSGLIIKCTR